MNTYKNKCDFCHYKAASGCMVTPNSHYCKEATNEYYQYLRSKQVHQPVQKSLRSWDRK